MVAQFDNQLLRGLLPKRHQLDACHDRALNPAVTEAQRQLAHVNAPAHAEPRHAAELALPAQRQPFCRAVRLPAFDETRKGRSAVAFFFAQLARFPTGEQVCRPASGRRQVVPIAGLAETVKQRQIDAEKTLLHLLDLPAFKGVGVRDPARLHGPLQPLRPGKRPDRQAAAGELHQAQPLAGVLHQLISASRAETISPPPKVLRRPS